MKLRIKSHAVLFFKKHPIKTILLTILLCVFFGIVAFINFYRFQDSLNVNIKVSALKKGEYGRFLDAFISTINVDTMNYHVKFEKIDAIYASRKTIEQLDSGIADIGLAQANTKRNSKNVASIAYIYIEPYLLFTNRDEINSIHDIEKCKDTLKIVRLQAPSQTSKDLLSLIDFYYLDSNKFQFIDADYDSALVLLQTKKVDCGFFIVGLGNQAIKSMVRSKSLHLIAFENIEAYTFRKPKLLNFKLPKGAYGLNSPPKDYETFATKAMLIVRKDMDKNCVYKITEALFEKESEIASNYPFFQLEKIDENEHNYIPLHEGAIRYYQKDKPSFIDRNSNLIATVLATLGLIISMISLFKELKSRRMVIKKTKEQYSHTGGREL